MTEMPKAPTDIAKMSLASIVRSMSPLQQREFVFRTGLADSSKLGKKQLREIEKDVELGFLDFLDPAEKAVLRYSWKFWARPDQVVDMEDPSWDVWLALCGRGWGKTRSLSEWVRGLAENEPGIRIGLIGPTAASTRDVIVKGDSGILACSPPWLRAEYSPANSVVKWSNGSQAQLFSSEEPERLRGPQFAAIAFDEICAYGKNGQATWDMAMMCLRLGRHPRVMIATTPKPTELLKKIIANPRTRVVGGSTYENADNLAPTFISTIIRQYEGTDLGRQELHAELLLENKNALWNRSLLSATRESADRICKEDMVKIVVAIDPPATSGDKADECGIVVVGMDLKRHGYVLADLSGRMTPKKWAQVALQAHKDFEADTLVAERNNGGEMVKHTIRSYKEGKLDGSRVHVKTVFASRGKWTRAEPVASLFQQGRGHMVGLHPKLEDQLCEYDPFEGQKSPDRFDAMVWGFHELLVKSGARFFA